MQVDPANAAVYILITVNVSSLIGQSPLKNIHLMKPLTYKRYVNTVSHMNTLVMHSARKKATCTVDYEKIYKDYIKILRIEMEDEKGFRYGQQLIFIPTWTFIFTGVPSCIKKQRELSHLFIKSSIIKTHLDRWQVSYFALRGKCFHRKSTEEPTAA